MIYSIFFDGCFRRARVWLCAVFLLFAGCAGRTAYQYLQTALEYERGGQSEQALAAFQAAVETVPGDPYLRQALGRAYLRRQLYDEAEAEFERALASEPAYVALYLDLATTSEARKMPEAAIGWLERAIHEVPDYQPAYRQLVGLHLSTDRPDEAMTLLEGVVARWPEVVWGHYRLGRLQLRLKAYEQAEHAFRKAVELDPAFADGYASLGNALYEQKKYEEAITAYREAVELDPRDHSSLNNLAWVYAVQGRHLEEGIRYSRLSLRMVPDGEAKSVYLDTLAELYFRQGDYDRAVELIRYAISLEPEDPHLKTHLENQLRKFLAGGRGKV